MRARRAAQLALMSADREKEDTPIPTERLQLDGRTERAETKDKQKKICKKTGKGESGRR